MHILLIFFFFFQAEDGIRDLTVTGVQTCALPISMVRVHGSETWAPVLELALDEVHMQWIGEPRRAATPPVLTEGASAEHGGRDSAVVRLAAVTSVTELVARARAL